MLGSQILVAAAELGAGGIVGIAVATLVVGLVAGFFGYRLWLKKKQSDAETEYARVLEEARLEAKNLRKDALLEAKEEQHRLRNELDRRTGPERRL